MKTKSNENRSEAVILGTIIRKNGEKKERKGGRAATESEKRKGISQKIRYSRERIENRAINRRKNYELRGCWNTKLCFERDSKCDYAHQIQQLNSEPINTIGVCMRPSPNFCAVLRRNLYKRNLQNGDWKLLHFLMINRTKSFLKNNFEIILWKTKETVHAYVFPYWTKNEIILNFRSCIK